MKLRAGLDTHPIWATKTKIARVLLHYDIIYFTTLKLYFQSDIVSYKPILFYFTSSNHRTQTLAF